ncbi:uncharacterized protein K02A2.6-like [Anneissia japonica]|uniref:uncharacterized protein K02A2.6-like n=1 Tax=Anneissia japonica TaxID=1529436 RepID=UPI001425738B|nr:uncharacterized protein K02A2.6-like [Anneissia japonica]
MKAIARFYVWWPKLDVDIEMIVKNCQTCQSVRSTPPTTPLIPWKWPARPFQRVHVDYCEKDGNNFLVLIDSHSKWLEVVHMKSTTSSRTIEELKLIYSRYGLPEEVVSDNGPQFVSAEFKSFCDKNKIKHTCSPVYHAATNGAAKRAVSSKRGFD